MNWQPIETAPKDGRFILLAKFFGPYPVVEADQWHVDGDWWCEWTREPHYAPTHWLSLPKIPEQK